MYTTAVQMGYRGDPRDLSRPQASLPYVLKYLDHLKSRFDGDIAKVVSAYNAGPGNVGTNPKYTNKVLAHLDRAPAAWDAFQL